MKLACATLLAAVLAAAAASTAGANGDPASDVLPFTPVYLSIQDPKTSAAGRDLLNVTTAAAKKRQPIRVALFPNASKHVDPVADERLRRSPTDSRRRSRDDHALGNVGCRWAHSADVHWISLE